MMEYLASQSHFDLQNIDITSLSSYAHGFMACNLAHWFKLAEEMAIQESTQTSKKKNMTLFLNIYIYMHYVSNFLIFLSFFSVSEAYFKYTFSQINVIGQQGRMAEKPDPVKWSDIGGLMSAKVRLIMMITKS